MAKRAFPLSKVYGLLEPGAGHLHGGRRDNQAGVENEVISAAGLVPLVLNER